MPIRLKNAFGQIASTSREQQHKQPLIANLFRNEAESLEANTIVFVAYGLV
jgi:hypothetical protein